MLHVLPAGTYGLRPAVNRSNTRTWRATLRTGDCARCRWLARFLTLSLVPLSSPIFLLSTADYLRKYVLPDFKLLHRGRGTRVFSRTSDKYNKAYKYRIFRAIHASTSYNPMRLIGANISHTIEDFLDVRDIICLRKGTNLLILDVSHNFL